MSKKSASVSALEELHAATARYLKGRLEDSTAVTEPQYDEDGNEIDDFVLPLATGEVANIIAFLKHNNISAAPDTTEVAALSAEFKGDIEAQRIAKENALFDATPEELERSSWLH